MKVILPYNYKPRDYQVPVWGAFDRGVKRLIVVGHRRWGKDKTGINVVATKMFERKGIYYYFFPTYKQGKKILWDGMDKEGYKFLDHIPQQVRTKTNDTEMKITTKNGSLLQVIGTDDINSVVGTNPVGCVFSEYSLQDPRAWDFIRPILAENGGWALFIFTPRGGNHAQQLCQMAQQDTKNWFVLISTVEDTMAIPKDVLEQERREIISKDGNDALYQQEYMCSFTVPIAGAYYANQIMQAEKENRMKENIIYEPSIPVDTWWDLGIDDSMTIWFSQSIGQEIRFIDYYENSGEGLPHYISILQNKGYIYGGHYAPHDIEVRELTSGISRKDTARGLGLVFQTVLKTSIDEGIHAVRTIFNRCFFDKNKCLRGLNALKSYHKEYDEENKIYKSHPEHDWSSHTSDAFRTFAIGIKQYKGIVSSLDGNKKQEQRINIEPITDNNNITKRRAY